VTPPSAPAPAPLDSDVVLVARANAGDARAYELLVIKYQRRIERLIGRMVRDAALAQDIVQETFLRAWRGLHQFRGEARFYTWLYRIALNTANKMLLERKRDPVITEAALPGHGDGDGDGEDDETSRPQPELT
jgi:RNA polymerase sigma-70 factor (ECF subfamily)